MRSENKNYFCSEFVYSGTLLLVQEVQLYEYLARCAATRSTGPGALGEEPELMTPRGRGSSQWGFTTPTVRVTLSLLKAILPKG